MTALVNIPAELSNSFEYLPTEDLPQPLIPDSSPVLIVTASYDHTIRFWDVLQGTCVSTLQHNESVKQ
jgi:WD40 repeat protein